jgi:hypothetical protein
MRRPSIIRMGFAVRYHEDAMNMVRHRDERIQRGVVKMIGNSLPTFNDQMAE